MNRRDRILIVDDEITNLEFFDLMLSKLGFDVFRAEDGEEALDRIRDSSPDLIILDNVMPRLTGWEVTRILKQSDDYREFRDIPVIMFSAMDDVQDKVEGFELGIEDYITKPYNFSEVLARIKAVLRNRDLTRQLLQRERKLTVIESLNRSLRYFAVHLRKPVTELIDNVSSLDTSDRAAVDGFVQAVQDELNATVAALDGLEEEIDRLESERDEVQQDEMSLDHLEEKYQRHFRALKTEDRLATPAGEVSS